MRPDERNEKDELALSKLAERLKSARSLLFVTGAGLSAESGVPTYRGIGGLYHDRATDEGLPIEEALSGRVFAERPEITWKYLHQIEASCRGATSNRAHGFLASLERTFDRVWVLTQNVDGFHRQAGTRNIIDIHGDIHDLFCTSCDRRERVHDFSRVEPCPRCPRCGGQVRPDVVLFGELLPGHKVERMEKELSRGFDAVFSIGTTSLFPYIARPVIEARQNGKLTVEINPEETTVSDLVDLKLSLGAVAACNALARHMGVPGPGP